MFISAHKRQVNNCLLLEDKALRNKVLESLEVNMCLKIRFKVIYIKKNQSVNEHLKKTLKHV